MIRRQKIKRIQREKKTFRREYIPLIFAVLFLICLVVALVYTIMYKPDKTIINELYSMETEEVPVDITNIACNNDVSSKIQNDANNVKVRYEELDDYVLGKTEEIESDLNGDGVLGEIDDIGYALRVTITGLTENIYIKLENSYDYELPTYKYSDSENGVITFVLTENPDIRTYIVQVYSNNNECGNILYREFRFTLPRFNMMANSIACTYNKELESCKPFVFDNNKQEYLNMYQNEMKELKEKQENKEESKKELKDYIKEYKLYIIILGVLVFVGIFVIVMKRRR